MLAGAVGGILGVILMVMCHRVASRVSLALLRRAVRAFMLVAFFFVVAELADTLRAFGFGDEVVIISGNVAEVLVVVCLGVAVYILGRSGSEEISELLRLANVDELTALSTRAFFRRAAERRFTLSREHGLPLSCLVLDIDDFKLYNDLYGHEAGDDALRCVARAIREGCRGDDLVARYGGEEFMVLMNGDREVAAAVAERIRLAVVLGCQPDRNPRLRRQMTVSIGASTLDENTGTLQNLISAADREMYHAKRAGKNRVSIPG